MKNLKRYEAYTDGNLFEWYKEYTGDELKVNDYVITFDVKFTDEKGKWTELLEEKGETRGKIIKIEIHYPKEISGVTFLIGFENNSVRMYKDGIIRKMTPEEIEQFEIEKTSNKYNL